MAVRCENDMLGTKGQGRPFGILRYDFAFYIRK